MIDVIRLVMERMTKDTALLNLLRNDKHAICRIRSPKQDKYPRIELAMVDDADGDYYDGHASSYIAEFAVLICDKQSDFLFAIANQVDLLLRDMGCNREKHTDGYIFELELYVKELSYRIKLTIGEDNIV